MEVSHWDDSLAKGHVGGVGWVTVGTVLLTPLLVFGMLVLALHDHPRLLGVLGMDGVWVGC